MTDERSASDDGSPPRGDATTGATRSATLRTTLADADVVAAAVRPDNTPQIDTRVEREADGPDVVVTTIERSTTGGLRTTVDDYAVNLAVARDVVQHANRHADTQTDTTHDQ